MDIASSHPIARDGVVNVERSPRLEERSNEENRRGEREACVEPPRKLESLDSILELDLPFPEARRRLLAEFESRYVERMLRLSAGKINQAAAAAGIVPRYFRYLRARSRSLGENTK